MDCVQGYSTNTNNNNKNIIINNNNNYNINNCVITIIRFQVNFSEGGPGSNSTGSEVASMSSQLPDTPNSMVASPIEA